MVIRSPWDNRVSRRDDSLLAQLAGQEIDALARLSHLQASPKPRPTIRPARPEPPTAQAASHSALAAAVQGEPETAQEVSFAEVLRELQSRVAPHQPGDALPDWPRSNIQNAPPAVAKLLGMKT